MGLIYDAYNHYWIHFVYQPSGTIQHILTQTLSSPSQCTTIWPQFLLHVILIKFASRVWGWFALETLVWLGILSNFSNKLSHHLIRFLKGHLKIHHIMHIWSTMSQESPNNWRLASWLMVVGQMNSSAQNRVSLDPISYNFHHMKMIPRETLL